MPRLAWSDLQTHTLKHRCTTGPLSLTKWEDTSGCPPGASTPFLELKGLSQTLGIFSCLAHRCFKELLGHLYCFYSTNILVFFNSKSGLCPRPPPHPYTQLLLSRARMTSTSWLRSSPDPTNPQWKTRTSPTLTSKAALLFFIYTLLLGDYISWL